MSYSAFQVQSLDNGQIAKVSINRPKSMNAMNPAFFQELETIFRTLNTQWQDLRTVIFVGNGKVFTAGLDLKQFGGLFSFDLENSGKCFLYQDVARQSIKLYDVILKMQRQFLSIIECKVPVLMGIHNACVGGGIDLICMADIRYCTSDSKYTIKQIDIGMAADLGTLQIFPNIIGNQSTFRELSYTGRWMDSQQAKQIGLVSKVFQTKEEMEKGLLQTARLITAKSPVAINTLKHIMRRQQYKKVYQSMQYMARTNSSMLFTQDTLHAISAFLQKKTPTFPKL